MSWGLIIMFIVIGLIFLLLEVLVIPGATVAGIVGAVFLGVGIWQAYATHGATAGHITLASSLAATILLLTVALKSKTWNKAKLKTAITGTSGFNMIKEGDVSIGDSGKTISRLNPMGKAKINSKYLEVYSVEGFIDEHQEVEVSKIEKTKIYVKLKNT